MTRMDYVRFANNEMILKIIEDRELLHVPIETLQNLMLRRYSWNLYRKKFLKK